MLIYFIVHRLDPPCGICALSKNLLLLLLLLLMLAECWPIVFNAAQPSTNIGSTSRVCWDVVTHCNIRREKGNKTVLSALPMGCRAKRYVAVCWVLLRASCDEKLTPCWLINWPNLSHCWDNKLGELRYISNYAADVARLRCWLNNTHTRDQHLCKHKTSDQCWLDVGPSFPSLEPALNQHLSSLSCC